MTGARRRIAVDALSIGLADGAAGMSFGAVASSAHLSVLQACALSVLCFTGASQFALAGVIGNGGAALTGTLPALLLGTRNGLYSVRLATLLPRRFRWASAQLVIDESTGLALAQADPADARRAFFSAGGSVFVFWNLGTLIGAVAGSVIGDPRRFGLDAVGPAVFLVLLAPHLRGRGEGELAVIAGLLTLAVATVTPAGVPVLLAGCVAVPFALWRRR